MSEMINKLINLDLKDETIVTLTYSEGTDVFVHNETEVETALDETHVVNAFSDLITTPGLKVKTTYGHDVMDSLRDSYLLEDYPRDFSGFSEFVADVIRENFYDIDYIDYSVEKYDHKRGFCTLSADVKLTLSEILETRPPIDGWKASVKTANGTLTIN